MLAPPMDLLGVRTPAGTSYGPVFANPRSAETVPSEGFPADLGVGLDTDTGRWRLIHTDAAGYFVHVAVDNTKPPWPRRFPDYLVNTVDLLSLAARLGSSDERD